MTFSAGIVAYGIVDSSIAASVGGGLAGVVAAAMMALAKARAWAVDTSAERRRLDDALQQASDERTRYLALGVAQREEHRRRIRDLEAERACLQQRFEAEKAALEDDFASRHEQLIVEATETALRLYHAGLLSAPTHTAEAQIVPFPQQQPTRARATEHPADPTPGREATRDRGAARP
ncbi:hypothetical protein OOK31_25310 [Streptomyces sp. NBC_00249]|uniref:hypothetical protein n=1 Tax=Streptomyces sp. NBC_00249 TaxID=2975690 RepID=UPI002250D159|nr:hypothetical protein [Streptomyces sp. NBC_00249]MCX5197175.1 hypothetical protein [Streptomyces sp. NBC_00249]